MHTVRQPAGSGIDGQSMVRQAVSATPPIPVIPVIPVISLVGARIGRATRPSNATMTTATLRIPTKRYRTGLEPPCRVGPRRRNGRAFGRTLRRRCGGIRDEVRGCRSHRRGSSFGAGTEVVASCRRVVSPGPECSAWTRSGPGRVSGAAAQQILLVRIDVTRMACPISCRCSGRCRDRSLGRWRRRTRLRRFGRPGRPRSCCRGSRCRR